MPPFVCILHVAAVYIFCTKSFRSKWYKH